MPRKVRVWDLPTRVVHWLLAAFVVGSFISGWRGGDAMVWHARFGEAALALLLFRILWGVVGGRWSRFTTFRPSPARAFAYARGKARPDDLVGHNPLGAFAVFGMLTVLLVQVATGLVGDDEIAFTGPLNRFVSNAHALAATGYHRRIGQWLVLGLVALHVAAVLWYLLRRKQNLVRPMLLGDKWIEHAAASARDDRSSRMLAVALGVVCTAAVWWLVQLGN